MTAAEGPKRCRSCEKPNRPEAPLCESCGEGPGFAGPPGDHHPEILVRRSRRRVIVPAVFLTVFAFLLFTTHSTPPAGGAIPSPGGERVLSFHSDITVMTDGSMEVKESITVRAGGVNIKRGIYRDFPTRYRDRLGNRINVGFEVVAVARGDRKEPFHTKPLANGVRVYIGSKSVYLDPGEYTYTLTYRTTRQLGFFKDYDELYWNVTGNGWSFPIDAASAAIRLPEGAEVLSRAAYTGPSGATGKDFTTAGPEGGIVRFATTRSLGPGEGLTVAVAWPKGIVAEPGIEDRARFVLQDNRTTVTALAGLVLILLYYTAVWLKVGRDPPAGAIVPLYGPPEAFSPAAVGFVRSMGYTPRAFTAAIVNMAVKGHLTIEQEGESDFTLRRVDDDESALSAGERKVAGKLFGSSSSIALERTNHVRIGGAFKSLRKSLKGDFEKLHFVRNTRFLGPGAILTALALGAVALTAPNRQNILFLTVWLSAWSVGSFGITAGLIGAWGKVLAAGRGAKGPATRAAVFLTLFGLPFLVPQIVVLMVFARTVSPVAAAVLLLAVGANLTFYWLLRRPTLQGRRVMDRIEGFKMYLEATEQDRLDRLNPPERTPRLFEEFLPYALALGVENAWAEKFSGVLAGTAAGESAYRPTWYSGQSLDRFSPGTMAASLGTSLSSAVSSSSTAPGSSSGSGGGGSSGGGGGGGGGGGW